MVAGIVLLALGLKKTLAHVEDPLKVVPAFAMLGGTAIYLLALATLAIMSAILVALIVYETRRFAELRDRLRHQLASD
jgi:hypothetical protein